MKGVQVQSLVGQLTYMPRKFFFLKKEVYWHLGNQCFIMQHKANYSLFVSLNIKDMYASLVYFD